MPELPEIETPRRGVAPLPTGWRVAAVEVRERRLRRPHQHVAFRLDDGWKLRYADARQFGLIDLIRDNTLDEDSRLRGLDVEPLEDAMRDE